MTHGQVYIEERGNSGSEVEHGQGLNLLTPLSQGPILTIYYQNPVRLQWNPHVLLMYHMAFVTSFNVFQLVKEPLITRKTFM